MPNPGARWLGLLAFATSAATAAPLYDNLTPNDLMAMASRPASGGQLEVEAADDFFLASPSAITAASFIGLASSLQGAAGTIANVVVEIYRVFPQDSDTGRLPNVPTRVNSPSDVALDSRDGALGELAFSSTVLASSFTASNSVGPGGIHPKPATTTGGDGPVTGEEVQIHVTFATPIDLAPGHYFFVPQVDVGSSTFYWLSASRPISGAGTTPFNPDLQAWIRDEALAPDWVRVGTDIVGSGTFNGAFALDGGILAVPEPGTLALLAVGFVGWAPVRRRRAQVLV